MKNKMTSAKNLICGITRRKNRRKKAAPKETIEIQPKIKEEIIKEEIEEVTVEDNDDTPKRSNIKRILDSWKSVSPQKKSEVKTPKVTRFSIFDDFKDSKDSKTPDESPQGSRVDSIESRKSLYFFKSCVLSYLKSFSFLAKISQSMSPDSNILNLENGFNSSDQLTPSPGSDNKPQGKISFLVCSNFKVSPRFATIK